MSHMTGPSNADTGQGKLQVCMSYDTYYLLGLCVAATMLCCCPAELPSQADAAVLVTEASRAHSSRELWLTLEHHQREPATLTMSKRQPYAKVKRMCLRDF